mmetsp:Transcript_13324/g.31995  ORF Transcript_13324/g.31995 Transcript_13324/m.31995 type:complete len:89 (+) Transcript_13324:269-535(+)
MRQVWRKFSLHRLTIKPIQLSSINPDGPRGFVHRLDRGTSGCLIVAKTNQWYSQLLTQFFLRRVETSYIALVYQLDSASRRRNDHGAH